MSLYGPTQVSGTSQAHLGDVHHHHYNSNSEDEWQECLRALFLVDPRESKDSLKSRKGNRVNGTCEWFLSCDELSLWRRSVSPRTNTFWLYGHPGTGKSTLSIYLVEVFEEQFSQQGGALLAYFFCDNTSKQQSSATAILRGLLYQLSRLVPTVLTSILLPEYLTKGDKLFESFQALWHIFDAVVRTAAEDLFIFIDALDECDQASQELILEQLTQPSARVRFFITSRPYPAIREALGDFASRDLASFSEVKADIDLFVSDKVSKLTLRKKYTPRLRKEVTDLLTSRAEGTFLWVGLACAEMQRLPAKAGLDLLKSLPPGLNLIYNELYERAIVDAIEADGHAEYIKNILKFIAVAVVPMTIAQLSSACNLYQDELDSERDLFTREKIEACRFMVVVDNKYVRLLHKSVKDFLFGSMMDHFPSLLRAHAELAHRCVSELIRSFRSVQTPEFSMSYDDFYRYSARNWTHHARLALQEYRVPVDQREFFEHSSKCRDDWLSYLLTTGEEIPLYFSLFDVAAKWGITSLLDYAISTISDAGLTMTQFKDDVESGYGNPLLSAASCSYAHIFAYLLSLRAIEIDGKLHLVSHLDSRIAATTSYRLPVSVEVLNAACGNTHIGVDLVKSITSERGSEIVLNHTVLKALVSNESGGLQMLEILLKGSSRRIFLTPSLVNLAASQSVASCDILDLLQGHCRETIQISTAQMLFVVRTFDGKRVESTLKYYREIIPLFGEFPVAAIQNGQHRNEVFLVLLRHAPRPVHISQHTMRLIAEFFDSPVLVEIAKLMTTLRIGKLLEYAAANQCYGHKVVATILNAEPECEVPERAFLSAAQNRPLGGEILHLLFAHSPGTRVTSAIIAAAMNINQISSRMHSLWTTEESTPSTNDIETRLGILLQHFEESGPLSGEALEGLIFNDANKKIVLYSSALDVIDLLRQRHPMKLPDSFVKRLGLANISEENIVALIQRELLPNTDTLPRLMVYRCGVKTLEYVLDHTKIAINPKDLLMMAINAHNEEIIEALISRYGGLLLTSADCTSTGWGLYYFRHTYHDLRPEDKNLLLYSTVLHSDDDGGYVVYLLDLGADANYCHPNSSVLQLAIERGCIRCAEALFRKGASIYTLPQRGTAVLRRLIHESPTSTRDRLVGLLIEQGVDLNSRTTEKETPLVAALAKGRNNIAIMLIEAGADVNAYSTGDYSCALDAVARARLYGYPAFSVKVLQGLLQAGACLSPEMYMLLTRTAVQYLMLEAIWFLARSSSWLGGYAFNLIGLKELAYSTTKTICLLARLGIDTGILKHWDQTMLHAARRERDKNLISWLLKVSEDLRHSSGGHSACHVAQNDIPIEERRRIHYKNRIGLMTRTVDGETLIHLAAAEGRSEVVRWMLEECIHDDELLDVQDKCGRTALHRALQQSHCNVVEILIEHNASISIPDGTGRTAWEWMAVLPVFRPLTILTKTTIPSILAELRRLRALPREIEYRRARLLEKKPLWLGQLGRLLSQLGYHDEAARAFEDGIKHDSDPPNHQDIMCDVCDQVPIIGIRYVCCKCDDCDLCEHCWEQRKLKIHLCCDQHKSQFIPVPRANWKEDAIREPTGDWLERLFQMSRRNNLTVPSVEFNTGELNEQ